MLIESVFGLLKYSYKRRLVKIVKRDYNGKSADKLGNYAVLDYVVSYNVLVNTALNLFLCGDLLGRKSYLLSALALLDNRLNTVKRAAANKEDILVDYLY